MSSRSLTNARPPTTLVSGHLMDRLKSILNAAAWLVFSAKRSEHITPRPSMVVCYGADQVPSVRLGVPWTQVRTRDDKALTSTGQLVIPTVLHRRTSPTAFIKRPTSKVPPRPFFEHDITDCIANTTINLGSATACLYLLVLTIFQRELYRHSYTDWAPRSRPSLDCPINIPTSVSVYF